jgi:hypothetical protein
MALGQKARVAAKPRPFKICDSLCGARVGVRFSVVTDEEHFRNFSCGTNRRKGSIRTPILSKQSDFTVVPLGKKSPWISPFSIPKDRDHDLSSGKPTLKLLRPWGFCMAQLCRLPLGFGFIMVDTGFFFLENLGQKP